MTMDQYVKTLERPDYIGDGVYVGVRYGMLWLATEREFGIHEIALEPEVWHNLLDYVKRTTPRRKPNDQP